MNSVLVATSEGENRLSIISRYKMNVVLAGGSPLAIVVQWNVYLRLSIDISPFIGSD